MSPALLLTMNNLPIHSQFDYYYYCTTINNLSRNDALTIGKELISYYLQQKKTLLMMFFKDVDADFVISKNVALDSHILTTRLQALYDSPAVPRKPIIDLLLSIVTVIFEHKNSFRLILADNSKQREVVAQINKPFDINTTT